MRNLVYLMLSFCLCNAETLYCQETDNLKHIRDALQKGDCKKALEYCKTDSINFPMSKYARDREKLKQQALDCIAKTNTKPMSNPNPNPNPNTKPMSNPNTKPISNPNTKPVSTNVNPEKRTTNSQNGKIEQNKAKAKEYNSKGLQELNRDNYKAIEHFTKAIEINPKYQVAYFNRAIAYLNEGEYYNAIKDANDAIRLSPRSGNSYHILGTAYLLQKKYEDAIKNYSKAIELPRAGYVAPFINQGKAESYYLRAVAYYNIGRYEEALDDINQAIVLDPQNEVYKSSKKMIEASF